jgi:hypothetical protein
MNTYVVTIPISITIDAENKIDALRAVIDDLTGKNINCDDVINRINAYDIHAYVHTVC